jgi:hypothetical protein
MKQAMKIQMKFELKNLGKFGKGRDDTKLLKASEREKDRYSMDKKEKIYDKRIIRKSENDLREEYDKTKMEYEKYE